MQKHENLIGYAMNFSRRCKFMSPQSNKTTDAEIKIPRFCATTDAQTNSLILSGSEKGFKKTFHLLSPNKPDNTQKSNPISTTTTTVPLPLRTTVEKANPSIPKKAMGTINRMAIENTGTSTNKMPEANDSNIR